MDERLYSTYIVASQTRVLYIGVTGNLLRRVFEHKWKERDGFSCRYHCDRLVWFEHYQQVELAIAREKQLKGWSRAKKIALIERVNPTWADLSRDWYECEPRGLYAGDGTVALVRRQFRSNCRSRDYARDDKHTFEKGRTTS